jgi:hypothetical protein
MINFFVISGTAITEPMLRYFWSDRAVTGFDIAIKLGIVTFGHLTVLCKGEQAMRVVKDIGKGYPVVASGYLGEGEWVDVYGVWTKKMVLYATDLEIMLEDTSLPAEK